MSVGRSSASSNALAAASSSTGASELGPCMRCAGAMMLPPERPAAYRAAPPPLTASINVDMVAVVNYLWVLKRVVEVVLVVVVVLLASQGFIGRTDHIGAFLVRLFYCCRCMSIEHHGRNRNLPLVTVRIGRDGRINE